VGCYHGLQTMGGTRGVGKSTTQAVVMASILVLMSNFLITKLVISLLGWNQ
jgi:phospholipid/cholesterol/gamma-HCH transport system permease protein